jgi:hypothetical protein
MGERDICCDRRLPVDGCWLLIAERGLLVLDSGFRILDWGGYAGRRQGYTLGTGLTHDNIPGEAGGSAYATLAANGSVALSPTLGTPMASAGTYYFGFLMQFSGSPHASVFSFSESAGQPGNDNIAYAGIWNSQPSRWDLAWADPVGSWGTANGGASSTNTTLFVIKLELGATDKTTLYINPLNAAALSGAGNATKTYGNDFGDVSSVAIELVSTSSALKSITLDEIRIGTTAQDMFDVIPIPEPSAAMVALGLGGTWMLGRRRRA